MEYAIRIQDITKKYPDFVLNKLTLDIPKGCIMGFIGENGAGKSTTIKAILDVIRLDSGSIEILGEKYTNLSTSVKEDIGVVMDNCSFSEELTVSEIEKILKKVYKNWSTDTFFGYINQFNLPLKVYKRIFKRDEDEIIYCDSLIS